MELTKSEIEMRHCWKHSLLLFCFVLFVCFEDKDVFGWENLFKNKDW